MTDWDKATYEALQEDTSVSEGTPSTSQLAIIQSQGVEIEVLRETLSDVHNSMLAFEDRGWSLIAGLHTEEHIEGLTLDEVKDISKAIRPYLVADTLIKRGSDLHIGYVWSKGMQIDGIQRTPGKRGPKTKIQTFFENRVNQDNIFSPNAKEELQRSRYSDGNVFLACNKDTQTVRRIPLEQIVAIRVNPDFPDEVWLYKRKWHPEGSTGLPQERWYYTNRYTGKRLSKITEKGHTVKVAPETMIDRRFNTQTGWPLGIPDAVAAMVWSAAYTEIITYGRVVTKSLAAVLYKISSKTPKGAQQAGLKIAGMTGVGNAATMASDQDVEAIRTAGKGYDFSSARPVAAMAAAALNVPNMELLSDSSAAGSSYGAAQSLTPSTKNAMRMMQAEWVNLYNEIFDFMGLDVARVWFEPLDDVDLYRHGQTIALHSQALSDEEYRGSVLDLLDIPGDPTKIPDTLKMRSEVPDPGAAAQAAAPDQGRSNGSGGGGRGSNDQRSDTISSKETLLAMQNADFLDRFEELVNRMEAASGS